MHAFKRQRGQMAIGAALAIAVLAVALAAWVTIQQREQRDSLSAVYGHKLSQFAVGLRGYVAAIQAGTMPMAGNTATFVGSSWLKPPPSAGCADGDARNPDAGFIPCTFDTGSTAIQYYTEITRVADAGPGNTTYRIEARTYFMVPGFNEKPNARASFASKVAFAAAAQQSMATTGTFYAVFANSPETADAQVSPDNINAVDRGRVMAVVSNAPQNDVYLRVDGTNKMLADLDMGGNSIKDAANGTFNQDLRVKGIAQIDKGLTVSDGPADFRAGVTASDIKVTSINRTVSQGLYDMKVLTGSTSYTVNKPDCSKANLGSSQASIYVAQQSTGSAGGYTFPGGKRSDALYDSRIVVEDHGGPNSGYWTVKPEIRTTQFSLTGSQSDGKITLNLNKDVSPLVSSKDQTILVMTKCR